MITVQGAMISVHYGGENMERSDQQRLGSRSLGARVQSTSCMFLWSAALYTSQYINYITLQLHYIPYQRPRAFIQNFVSIQSSGKIFLSFSVMVESVLQFQRNSDSFYQCIPLDYNARERCTGGWTGWPIKCPSPVGRLSISGQGLTIICPRMTTNQSGLSHRRCDRDS